MMYSVKRVSVPNAISFSNFSFSWGLASPLFMCVRKAAPGGIFRTKQRIPFATQIPMGDIRCGYSIVLCVRLVGFWRITREAGRMYFELKAWSIMRPTSFGVCSWFWNIYTPACAPLTSALKRLPRLSVIISAPVRISSCLYKQPDFHTTPKKQKGVVELCHAPTFTLRVNNFGWDEVTQQRE